ncbi:hypothetical protein AVEN_93788-1, partial [Araneus ventricosus]
VEMPEARKEKDGATPPVTSSPSTPDYAAGLLTTSQVRHLLVTITVQIVHLKYIILLKYFILVEHFQHFIRIFLFFMFS